MQWSIHWAGRFDSQKRLQLKLGHTTTKENWLGCTAGIICRRSSLWMRSLLVGSRGGRTRRKNQGKKPALPSSIQLLILPLVVVRYTHKKVWISKKNMPTKVGKICISKKHRYLQRQKRRNLASLAWLAWTEAEKLRTFLSLCPG